MRLSRATFRARVNGNLNIEFGKQSLTSYAGLELLLRFCRGLELRRRLTEVGKRAGTGGDADFGSLVLLVVAMLIVGGRRLRHLKHLEDDPMIRRFSGLNHIPDRTTLGRFLRRFTPRMRAEFEGLDQELVLESLSRQRFARLTLDIDGSVLTTGLQVERAFRGFNPHNRKNPSYYPQTIQVAQTGHILAHKNRSGNVHDSVGSAAFLEKTILNLKRATWFNGVIEVRADGAFFQRKVFEILDRQQAEYALRVPMVPWLGIKSLIATNAPQEWLVVDKKRQVEGFFMPLPIPQWDRTERVAVFRKRVQHKARKSKQLDLFHPDDGHWEYSVVATNKLLQVRAIWDFYNGRGAHEKTYRELKSGYAFASIPSSTYRGNTAWQKLGIFSHNLVTSFQLATGAERKKSNRKRTAFYRLRSILTLRFEWLTKAGRLLRPHGRQVLRLEANEATKVEYERLQAALADSSTLASVA